MAGGASGKDIARIIKTLRGFRVRFDARARSEWDGDFHEIEAALVKKRVTVGDMALAIDRLEHWLLVSKRDKTAFVETPVPEWFSYLGMARDHIAMKMKEKRERLHAVR